MVVREILVVKKPRDGHPIDKPATFPPLQNLHLHLMENKKKLKKNLPQIQIKKAPPVALPASLKPYTQEMMAGTKSASTSKVVDTSPKPKTSKDSPVKEVPQKSQIKSQKSQIKSQKVDEVNEEVEDLGDLEDIHEEPDEAEEKEEDQIEKDLGINAPDADTKVEEIPETQEEKEDDPYAGLSPEEREAKEREEYIWRFKIMKKQYKNKNIPDFNEHDDVNMMKLTYERTLKEISLDDNVENYRTYLIGGFMVMEFVAINWMNIDLAGFTTQQMLVMSKYDRMLIELGEKSYNRWGANLPVEIRLIGFIILQAGLFYLGKIIADKAGSSIAELFKGMTGQSTVKENVRVEESDVPKKKMRGPSVKVEDLKKKMSET